MASCSDPGRADRGTGIDTSYLPSELAAILRGGQAGFLAKDHRTLAGVGEARPAGDFGHGMHGAGKEGLAALEVNPANLFPVMARMPTGKDNPARHRGKSLLQAQSPVGSRRQRTLM